MVTCAKCGDEIPSGSPAIGLREQSLAYHLGCAPGGLLGDAVGEWNAIVTRGVSYFVDKYGLAGPLRTRSGKEKEQSARKASDVWSAFTEMGQGFQRELDRRKGRGAGLRAAQT